MLSNVSKKIELAANLAIVVVACLFAIVLIKNELLNKSAARTTNNQNQPAPLESKFVGNPNLSSLDIDWKQSRQTLILAISESCHFCTESAPFYKELVQKKGSTRLIAILPQSVEDGTKYLQTLGVSVDEIRQLSLDRIGVRATPTLLLVDATGALRDSWIGILPPDKEADVLGSVQR